ncbi:hypothetical protein Tco_0940564 [Tanacetum coccineum]|uniref:Zinc finger, CCHC-type n=1 Tax=Tanacetum coccineum TaxID=301880 RepID=A0ABQ5DNW0_9ASTR
MYVGWGVTVSYVAAAMKYMASNFTKLDKFEGVDFRRWQKKMHFLLFSMGVVYVLNTPMTDDGGDNPTVKQNVESSKELYDSLEAKYIAENASSKKFLVSNFINYKMTDSRLVLEQYNELLGILERMQDSDKPKGNNVAGPLVFNMLAASRVIEGPQSSGVKSRDLSVAEVRIQKISLTGFSQAAYSGVLDYGASQSRQHHLIHIESRKSPTKSLFDVGSRRISIFTVNTKEYHSDVLAIITRIMRRT